MARKSHHQKMRRSPRLICVDGGQQIYAYGVLKMEKGEFSLW